MQNVCSVKLYASLKLVNAYSVFVSTFKLVHPVKNVFRRSSSPPIRKCKPSFQVPFKTNIFVLLFFFFFGIKLVFSFVKVVFFYIGDWISDKCHNLTCVGYDCRYSFVIKTLEKYTRKTLDAVFDTVYDFF